KLVFGRHFNQKIDLGVLPKSQEELEFEYGSHFNHPLVAGMFGKSNVALAFCVKNKANKQTIKNFL
ncbi:MAG: FNIP repeat-containing protein, partial [Flavobacterium sp.]